MSLESSKMENLMKRILLASLCMFALFGFGCSSAPTPSPTTTMSGAPDAEAGRTLTWETFSPPDAAFTVEVPGKLEEQKSAQAGVHRFRTREIPQHAVYDVGYFDLTPHDKKADRAQIVAAFMGEMLKGGTVRYRQAGRFSGSYPSEMASFVGPDGKQVAAMVFAGQDRLWVVEVIVPANVKDMTKIPTHRFMGSLKVKDIAPPLAKSDAGPSGVPAASSEAKPPAAGPPH
jgi:hypothetical protein